MTLSRSTEHFIWNTSLVLGKGATGAVYQGMNKTTGEQVAVKTFNHSSLKRSPEVQMREFELLTILKHKNIVSLLAIEEEVESRKKVIITELCTGGSLYTILDDPENSYGLVESEFLCVLKDISAGMKYLRDNKIIHRDLKPGNIMKFITEDGTSVYKLIDFGAARELEEGQQFVSLYGTEEYLHPDMYERAVLLQPAVRFFRATVDLWSIGVTLYHVATGSLPFRPFGGRRNQKTMYKITTKKSSGVISGVQHNENGPIEWSSELPKTCLLPQELQDLVTVMLAGILECDHEKMWTFDQFFDCVSNIISRRVIHVFYVNESKEVSLYLEPHRSLKDLKEQLSVQVKVPPANQVLLFDKVMFETMIDSNAEISTYPAMTPSKPLILLHNENTDIKDATKIEALLTCFPAFRNSHIDIEHDAAKAKICCRVAHAVKRFVEELSRCRELLLGMPAILLSIIHVNVTKLCENLGSLKQRFEDVDRRFRQLEKNCAIVSELVKDENCENDLWNMKQIVFERKQSKDQLEQRFVSLESSIQTLKQRVLVSGTLQKEWDESSIECPSLNGCIQMADTYVNCIREGWQSLARNKHISDRSGKSLSFHDEQFYILEKVKVQRNSKKLLSLLREQCLRSCLKASQKLDEWYSGMQATMVQCKCLDEDWLSVNNFAVVHTSGIEETEIEVDEITKKIILQSNSSKSSTAGVKIGVNNGNNNIVKPMSSSYNDFSIKVQDLTEKISDLRSLVDEHDSLIERLSAEKQNLKRLATTGTTN